MRPPVVVLVCVALLLAGCSRPSTTKAGDDRIVITITDDANGAPHLSTTNVTAYPNQLLEWRNAGQGTHSMAVDELGPYAHTIAFGPGASGYLKLGVERNATTYWHLHCTYHPNLTMTIVVHP